MITLDPTLVTSRERNSLALGAAFVLGSLADTDFVVAYVTQETYLHHHYFSHSIPFALAFTALCWIFLTVIRRRDPGHWAAMAGVAYATHLLLDYLTEDGSYPYGIPLLWPFTTTHFMAPMTIFYSIHRGTWESIFSPENLKAIAAEIVVMVPVFLLAVVIARRRTAK